MRQLPILAVLIAAVLAVPAFAATTSTTLRDDYFPKTKLTVTKGTTVVWKWVKTSNPHTVTDTKRRWGSKVKERGSYRHTFRKAGRFTVYCKIHPTTMRQRVIVK